MRRRTFLAALPIAEAGSMAPVQVARQATGNNTSSDKGADARLPKFQACDGGFGCYECLENREQGEDRVYAAAREMPADGTALAY
jgi:hypothetical protein